MLHPPPRSIAIPLSILALVLALPGYAQGTGDETGGGAGDYGTSQMNVPDPSEQAPPEIAPDIPLRTKRLLILINQIDRLIDELAS